MAIRRQRSQFDDDPIYVNRIFGGDAEAFWELWEKHLGLATNIVREYFPHCRRDDDTREQRLADVRFKVYVALTGGRFDPARPYKPWFAQVTRNFCRNEAAKHGNRETPFSQIEIFDSKTGAPLAMDDGCIENFGKPLYAEAFKDQRDLSSAREHRVMLDNAVKQLGPDDQTIYAKHFRERLSCAEIAQALDRKVGWVKNRCRDIENRLKNLTLSTPNAGSKPRRGQVSVSGTATCPEGNPKCAGRTLSDRTTHLPESRIRRSQAGMFRVL